MDLVEVLRQSAMESEPGTKFPTLRELMSRYGATQYAVHTALKALNAEGLLVSQVGSGSVVASRGAANAQAHARDIKVLILHHRARSERGDMVAGALHQCLLDQGFRVVSIAYGNGDDLSALLGDGRFDICVVQPRRSLLSTKLLDIARKCARHVVVEGRNLDGMEFDVVARDRRTSLRLALRHLRSIGHRNFGLISETENDGSEMNDYEQMFDFWSEVASGEVDGTPFVKRVESGDSQADTLGRVFESWKGLPPEERPTALIIYGHFLASVVSQACDAAGVNVPKDLSILKICSTSVEDLHDGFYTTVGRSAESVAAAVSELARWRLGNPSAPPRTSRAIPHLVARSSTSSYPT